ncbi:YARHG domain-containing protein [Pinisolibacter sp.]|uniref:YARHG domain-containing protein n=1 Tax=Pinisolibacter sp. TaxID=2172024 RepID=UPI002FDCCEE8
MSIRTTLAAAAMVVAVVPAGAEDYSAMSCSRLWYAENLILKRHGFCFTDPRAVKRFGNDGCTITMESRVPMTVRERDDRARIVLTRRMKLCR